MAGSKDYTMRFGFTFTAAMLAFSLTGWAQTQAPKSYHVKQSNEFKVKDPGTSTGGNRQFSSSGQNAANANARGLRSIEHESAAGAHHPVKKVATPMPKLERDKPAPQIEVKGSGQGRESAASAAAQNTLRGRLKQKQNTVH
jgi:hypothetical protein